MYSGNTERFTGTAGDAFSDAPARRRRDVADRGQRAVHVVDQARQAVARHRVVRHVGRHLRRQATNIQPTGWSAMVHLILGGIVHRIKSGATISQEAAL